MELSQTAICAARAYLQLAAETNGGLVSGRRITGDGCVPQQYLLEILRDP